MISGSSIFKVSIVMHATLPNALKAAVVVGKIVLMPMVLDEKFQQKTINLSSLY